MYDIVADSLKRIRVIVPVGTRPPAFPSTLKRSPHEFRGPGRLHFIVLGSGRARGPPAPAIARKASMDDEIHG